MGKVSPAILLAILSSLSSQELRDVYGLMQLELPWVLLELVMHAMVIRRMSVPEHDMIPIALDCIEFFSGTYASAQVAKAFEEIGCSSLAFDILRGLI